MGGETLTKKSNTLPILLCADQQIWINWLEKNYNISTGIRLHIAKKQSGTVTVSYEEAVEGALCYGWIDSQKEAYDDKTWLQRFTPRGENSIWSKVNKDKAELLISTGRMMPSGMNAIDNAKRNGRWDKAYEPQSSATIPEDFEKELNKNLKAKAFFETLDRQNKYAIMFRINNVKKIETRMKKIQQYISMLEKGEKIYP
jgi:uncharacterized protein YdeI (YjbR/CyaY-like superfamily)